MTEKQPPAGKLHPIRVVARRTGLTADVLRSWEKRHGAVHPARRGGRRLYSEEDLERLLLLRRATLGGRRIGQVAHLKTGEIRDIVAADEQAARNAPHPPGRARSVAAGFASTGRVEDREVSIHLERCTEAVRSLDPGAVEEALSRATVDLSRTATMEQIVVPLMRWIGEMWRDGELRVAHEHVASAVIRTFLGTVTARARVQSPTSALVVATPLGQRHEFGAMIAAATAAAEGWDVTYLGADLPAEEIAAAAHQRGARAVALSIVHPPDDPRLADDLRRLRRLLPEETAVVMGGEAASGYQVIADSIGAIRLDEMPSFRALLEGLRASGPPGPPLR